MRACNQPDTPLRVGASLRRSNSIPGSPRSGRISCSFGFGAGSVWPDLRCFSRIYWPKSEELGARVGIVTRDLSGCWWYFCFSRLTPFLDRSHPNWFKSLWKLFSTIFCWWVMTDQSYYFWDAKSSIIRSKTRNFFLSENVIKRQLERTDPE